MQPARQPAEAGRDVVADTARRPVVDPGRDERLQVGARAERVAGAGEDRDVEPVVVAEVLSWSSGSIAFIASGRLSVSRAMRASFS
jgi:hypothetical protein